MEKPIQFIRAGSLQSGEKYLCRTSPSFNEDRDFTTVTFMGYTACPAIVVVQDVNMVRIRCNRMDLFIPSESWEASNSPPWTGTQAASLVDKISTPDGAEVVQIATTLNT